MNSSDDNKGLLVILALFLFVAAAVIGTKMIYGQIVYDDWTCGITRCVKVKP